MDRVQLPTGASFLLYYEKFLLSKGCVCLLEKDFFFFNLMFGVTWELG
jgi:hypothetical protein